MAGRADVARRSGVTPAVVSYVTNGSHPVSDATRRRVLEAIKELNYRPNALARALATQRSHTIGLIAPSTANPFFAELAAAVEKNAFAMGYSVIFGNAFDDDERELDYFRVFTDRRVDGIVVSPSARAEHLLPLVRESGIPVVFTDRAPSVSGVPMVVVNNLHGAEVATRHLISHGRTLHACVTGRRDTVPAQERALGWRHALSEAGLNPRDDLLAFTDFSADAAYTAVREFLERESRIDALLMGSDLQSIGALRAIYDAGLTPGVDISVASFDGIEAGRYTHPSLTTVAQPFDAMADAVMSLLLRLIDGPPDAEDSSVTQILPTSLVIRESCGCPPQLPQSHTGTADVLTDVRSTREGVK